MSAKPKLHISSNRGRNCWLKVCVIFLIVVEMGLGVATISIGLLFMGNWSHIDKENTEECKYYEGWSVGVGGYQMRRVCSSSVSDVISNNYLMAIILGGVVIFSTAILQFVTSDKPICGLTFSITALLFVMQPTVSITLDPSNYRNAMMICLEFVLIPFAGIIYGLQQYDLKNNTSSLSPKKTDEVV